MSVAGNMIGFVFNGPAAGEIVGEATNKLITVIGPAAGKMVGKEPANWLFQSGLRPANMPYIGMINSSSFATVYARKTTLTLASPLVLITF